MGSQKPMRNRLKRQLIRQALHTGRKCFVVDQQFLILSLHHLNKACVAFNFFDCYCLPAPEPLLLSLRLIFAESSSNSLFWSLAASNYTSTTSRNFKQPAFLIYILQWTKVWEKMNWRDFFSSRVLSWFLLFYFTSKDQILKMLPFRVGLAITSWTSLVYSISGQFGIAI